MAHELESMFSVKVTPWHGLGEILTDAPDTRTGIIQAGLDWHVGLKPVYLADGRKVDVAQATVRESDGKILGVVGQRYEPLQNADAFSWFDPFVTAGLASLETAGSLRGGQRVWVLAKIAGDDMDIAKGDPVSKYILLSNSHDGTQAIRLGFTPIRVVCANTLAMAHNNGASQLIRVRHGRNAKTDLDSLRDVMSLANASFEATAEQMRSLARKTINQNDLKKYVKTVLGFEGEDDTLSTKAKNIVNDVIALAEHPTNYAARGTVWGAYNAVTYYLSHEAGRNADNRLNNLWFGSGVNDNLKAFNEALKLAA